MSNKTLDCTYCHKVVDVNEMYTPDHCSEKCFNAYRREEEFKNLSKPLIKFLNDNHNPHTKILIDNESAEVVSGEYCVFTQEYWFD